MTNHDLASLSQTIETAFEGRDAVNTGTAARFATPWKRR